MFTCSVFRAENAIIILINIKSCMHRCNIWFVWSAVPVIKMDWNRQNFNIWPSSMCIGDRSGWLRRIIVYQRQVLDVQQREFVRKNFSRLDVIWMKRFASGVGFLSVYPILGSLQSHRFAKNDWMFGKQLFLITMYNVSKHRATSLILIPTSAMQMTVAFVSGRPLRSHIAKVHHILLLVDVFFPVTL